MDRTGTVVSIEKVGHQSAIVVHGLLQVEEGQHLRLGGRVWTVTKRRWVRKPNVSLMLNPVGENKSLPEIDDVLEIMHAQLDDGVSKAEPDLTVETVVSFEKSTLVCARGILPVAAADVVTDGSGAWKVLDVTHGNPSALSKVWLSVKAEKGTVTNPAPNSRLLKKV